MKFPKTLMLAAGVLLASTLAAAAFPAVVTTDLNIRSGPGTRYAVIGSLQAGTTVNVGACSSGWCRVGGGFASARYLSGGGVRTRVVVQPDYYYDDGADIGLGVFALGVGPGWGWGYGPGWYGSGWRGGYWGGAPGWRGPGWRGPGRPGWYGPGRPGWRGAGWNRGGRPGWNGPGRPGWRGAGPGFRGPAMGGGRAVIYRPGGGFRGGMGGMGRIGGPSYRGGRF